MYKKQNITLFELIICSHVQECSLGAIKSSNRKSVVFYLLNCITCQPYTASISVFPLPLPLVGSTLGQSTGSLLSLDYALLISISV